MLLELPNGDKVDPVDVIGVRYMNDSQFRPRVCVDTHQAHHLVIFDKVEDARVWQQNFVAKVRHVFFDYCPYEFPLRWGAAVCLFRFHIIDRLVRKHNMSVPDATARQQASLDLIDPTIVQIIKDLITEIECKSLDFHSTKQLSSPNNKDE